MRQRGRDAEVHRWSSLNFLSLHPSSPPDSPSSKTTRYQNHQPRPAVKTIVFLSCDHKFHCCHHVRVLTLPIQIFGFLGLPLSFQSFMSSVPAIVVYDLMPMARFLSTAAVMEHAITVFSTTQHENVFVFPVFLATSSAHPSSMLRSILSGFIISTNYAIHGKVM